ncbi:peptidoglycan/LPS O-acetylase OafA/YrhL [Variovorax boronicumulans]|uniref:acyltransferase family protein n=1 Tax=Variovorax boronicumulans TaxID=436515 RepID=UPI00278AF6F9|nr:acyltransferase family protein [Variovorax boronicumulans]MDP9916282.1 peptidoglycan/LPS O-acetylase OafA/YrhL [Variovorax boronicumulans]
MHPKYRADIDGLRAVAVASVVIFHAFPKLLPGGFIGVDIFFVISGFLITTIIMQSHAAGDFSYRDFYARRIRRIFPALMLVLAGVLAFGWYVLLNKEFVELGKQALGGVGFVANFVFWSEAGYFDTAAETKPLLHLWSLGIEEQFYILWPLLLGLAWRRRWPIVRVLWVLAVVSFLINVTTIHPFRTAAFYSPASRFWELMVGGILACMRMKPSAPSVWRSHVQSVLGVGLIVLGLVMIRSDKAFPGWWALLPTLGAVSCIAAGPTGVLNKYFLSNRAMVWIGLISYPLYLWHWPLLVYARIVKGAEPSVGTRVTMVVASVLLAWLTYRFIERFTRARLGAGMLRTLVGTGAFVAVAGVAVLNGLPARHNSELLQKVTDATVDGDYYAGFSSENFGPYAVNRIGNGARKVLLIGDSHVIEYGPRAAELARLAPERMATTYFFTYGACPAIPNVFAEQNPGCGPARDQWMAMARDPQIDTVLIGSCWNCYFTGDFPLDYVLRANGASLSLTRGDRAGIEPSLVALQAWVTELVKQKKKVYLLLDNALGDDFEPRRMIEGSRLRTLSVVGNSPTAPVLADQVKLNQRLLQIAAASGAEAIDVLGALCKDSQCPRTMPDGAPAYKDHGHLRPAFTRQFATYLDKVFLEEGVQPAAAN